MSIDTGQLVMNWLEALAAISESDRDLTRRSFTPEHHSALQLVAEWMASAGMSTRIDAMGNLVGHFAGSDPNAPTLLLGSHIDTVKNAGAYDGALGVLLPVACVLKLHQAGTSPPFSIDVVAFCDEEGVRFQTTLLGSHAIAGTFEAEWLEKTDDEGITLGDALRAFGLSPDAVGDASRRGESFLGFLEVHIEQGPVLESLDLPVGVVTAIAGATRFAVSVRGDAGHAGTVPMKLRRDPMVAAAEAVIAIERLAADTEGAVATVGMLAAEPGAVNVIPGRVDFSLDARAGDDPTRLALISSIETALNQIGAQRGVTIELEVTHQSNSVACDDGLSEIIAAGIGQLDLQPTFLPSGAGHDAMAMASLCPVAMLFVRCDQGLSHHPDESITAEDAQVAADVLDRVFKELTARY
ncbi:MAG: allantoate amidohydrolase [Pseudomonadota bacterium]